jgi:hypothetical protein
MALINGTNTSFSRPFCHTINIDLKKSPLKKFRNYHNIHGTATYPKINM